VQEIALTNRANFAIAEKSGQSKGTKLLLHLSGIVTRTAEETMAPSIATAKASAIDSGADQLTLGLLEKRPDVFGRRGCIASLELNGLSRPRQRARFACERRRVNP